MKQKPRDDLLTEDDINAIIKSNQPNTQFSQHPPDISQFVITLLAVNRDLHLGGLGKFHGAFRLIVLL